MRAARLLIMAGLLVQLIELRSSYAYKLKPISRVFTPSGSAATQSFEVINDGPDRIALTVSILTLARDEQYNEISKPAEDDFLVYPPQMVLSPGKRQTLRITWLGDAKPASELTYRIVAQQVPIHLLDKSAPVAEAQGQVKVMISYRGTLFVRPPNAKPRIALEATRLDAKQVKVTLVNHGNAVGNIDRCTLKLQLGKDRYVDVPAATLAALQNSRVLARSRRSFIVKLPLDLAPLKAVGQCVVEA